MLNQEDTANMEIQIDAILFPQKMAYLRPYLRTHIWLSKNSLTLSFVTVYAKFA